MVHLGVNIDHVATIRQARRTYEPDPVAAAAFAEQGGADVITVHLREDRRHIQDRDVRVLRETVSAVRLNLEMACWDEIVDMACEILPDEVTLVPEKRQEVTTEGGLDISASLDRLQQAVNRMRDKGIVVSMFLDPDPRQIELAAQLKADAVELHTGTYALAKGAAQCAELERLTQAGKLIVDAGMLLHAGHGLNYQNVWAVAQIPWMRELNIGHSIVARAVFVGLREAVAQMKLLIDNAVR
jgi:pyridoxine 5-phosphate synthase